MSTAPAKTYRRFLLGIASEQEESLVEEAVLAGEVDASFLQDAEDELIDDYLLGSITPEERDGFIRHFLAVDERRQRVDFAAALVDYARKQSVEVASGDRKSAPVREIVSSLFWKRAALFATAASILLAALAGFNQIQLWREVQIASEARDELTRLHGAMTPGNSGSAQAHEPPSGGLTISQTGAERMPTIVFSAATRSVVPPSLLIPAQAQFVRIDSKLPLVLAEKYREVVLSSTGEQLWAQDLPLSTLLAASRKGIVLPASVLPRGPYHFQIGRVSTRGEFQLVEDYVFLVARE